MKLLKRNGPPAMRNLKGRTNPPVDMMRQGAGEEMDENPPAQ